MRSDPEEPGEPVQRMAPRALMAPPGAPEFFTRVRTLRAGPAVLQGRAWSGRAPIERVEVSTDGGATWADAELEPAGARPLGLARLDVRVAGRARRARPLLPRHRRRRERAAGRAALERRRLREQRGAARARQRRRLTISRRGAHRRSARRRRRRRARRPRSRSRASSIGSSSQVKVLNSSRRCVSSSARVQPSAGCAAAAASHSSMRVAGLFGIEGEDEVAEEKRAARPQQLRHASQRERLPEVGQVVERVPGVDRVYRFAGMLVAQEPGLHALDVPRLRALRLWLARPRPWRPRRRPRRRARTLRRRRLRASRFRHRGRSASLRRRGRAHEARERRRSDRTLPSGRSPRRSPGRGARARRARSPRAASGEGTEAPVVRRIGAVERFDAIVVGAGPAGSVTAYRLARAGVRVLLLDRARFPRDKPCGGGITLRARNAAADRPDAGRRGRRRHVRARARTTGAGSSAAGAGRSC